MLIAVIVSSIALLCYLILTIIVFWSNVQKKISVAFLLYMATMMFWQFTALLMSLSQSAAEATMWYRLMTAGLGGYPIFYAFFTQVFAKKKFSRFFLITGWIVYLSLIAVSMTDLVIKSVSRESPDAIYTPVFGPIVPLVLVVYFIYAGYALLTLIRSFRSEIGEMQRTRIVYLLSGFVLTMLGAVSNVIPFFQAIPLDVAANTLNAIMIAYVMVRYKLLDIRSVIRIGLRYSIPTVVIGTSYFLTIYYVVIVFHLISNENIFILSAIVAIFTAIIFQPFRDKLQVIIDKIFFREKYDTHLMLQRVSENAALFLKNLDNLAQMIVGEVADTLHLENMGIFLKKAETDEFILIRHKGISLSPDIVFRTDHPLVRWFDSNKRVLMMNEIEMIPTFKSLWEQERETLYKIKAELFVPIRAKDEIVGFFVLGHKLSGKQYTSEDVLVLGTLANQTAVTIENARLYWEKEETLKELREAHAKLETRVKERTKDLAVTNEKLTDALREKEILMREIHHRVKNNLQIISSLLKLQTRSLGNGSANANVIDILNATENRVRSIALVHEHLYASANLTNIDFSSYIRSIARHLAETYGAELRNININVRSEKIDLDIGRAIPCGIIINELITNALKYAFAENSGGIITIAFHGMDSGKFYLEIGDNGKGLADDIDPETSSSLGFKIVSTLVNQLKTSLDIKRSNGTIISMVIPPNQ